MNFGEKIAGLRKKNNMTQAELGDALSVTYQAVSKWERGESQPDFETMSRMAKLFGVSLSYFEEGGEGQSQAEPAPESVPPTQQPIGANMLGMCVNCGKVLYEGEAAATTPKLICHACAELQAEEERQREINAQKAKEAEEQSKKAAVEYAQHDLKKWRKIGLFAAIIPAVALFIIGLVLGLQPENINDFGIYLGAGCVLAVLGYTFTAQMIWDGVVRDVCLAGGHVISLPGIIFSFSPDGLIFLIVAKIFLGFVAAVVFFGTIFFCIFAAIVISPFTFVPSLLWHNREIREAGEIAAARNYSGGRRRRHRGR